MGATLLEEFLNEECTPYVRRLLEEALADATAHCRRFEFNRFEITVDRQKGVVLIEDVLDGSDTGLLQVPLSEFIAALDRLARGG
jgi:hypothetical protein